MTPGFLVVGGLPAAARDPGSYRQPTAVIFDSIDNRLLLSNAKTGSISIIDLKSNHVSEFPLGGSLRDLVQTAPGRFLTVDFEKHQLIEFTIRDQSIEVVQRMTVSR